MSRKSESEATEPRLLKKAGLDICHAVKEEKLVFGSFWVLPLSSSLRSRVSRLSTQSKVVLSHLKAARGIPQDENNPLGSSPFFKKKSRLLSFINKK